MLKIAMLMALTQMDEDLPFPPDPFDHNLPPLSVNDADPKASKDPSFLHIGLCVGSDINEKPILIADRLCFNRSALEIINSAVASRTQDMAKLSNENEKLAATIASMKDDEIRAAIGVLCFIAIAYVGGFATGRRNK